MVRAAPRRVRPLPGEVRPPAHRQGGRRPLVLRVGARRACATGCCSRSARSRSRSPRAEPADSAPRPALERMLSPVRARQGPISGGPSWARPAASAALARRRARTTASAPTPERIRRRPLAPGSTLAGGLAAFSGCVGVRRAQRREGTARRRPRPGSPRRRRPRLPVPHVPRATSEAVQPPVDVRRRGGDLDLGADRARGEVLELRRGCRRWCSPSAQRRPRSPRRWRPRTRPAAAGCRAPAASRCRRRARCRPR